MNFTKKQINCEKHGTVEALLNGNCVLCRDEKNRENQISLDKIRIIDDKISADVPKRYFEASFDTFIPTNDKMLKLVALCRSYRYSNNLLIVGNAGTGKTHLALSILNDNIKNRVKGFYTKFYKLNDIKIHNRRLFDSLFTQPVLIIDEIGVQQSDFKSNLLFEIIDNRYDNELGIILISNLTLKDFRDNISTSTYSRLKENIQVFECDWQDYRLIKGV